MKSILCPTFWKFFSLSSYRNKLEWSITCSRQNAASAAAAANFAAFLKICWTSAEVNQDCIWTWILSHILCIWHYSKCKETAIYKCCAISVQSIELCGGVKGCHIAAAIAGRRFMNSETRLLKQPNNSHLPKSLSIWDPTKRRRKFSANSNHLETQMTKRL